MDLAQVSFLLFAIFSAVRLFSYLPQIRRVALDANKASAISYATWSMWTGANLATALYAAANLKDLYLAAVSTLYAVCCLTVIALTAYKRLVDLSHLRQLTHERLGSISRRRADVMRRLREYGAAWSKTSPDLIWSGQIEAETRRCSRGIVLLDIHYALLATVAVSLEFAERRLSCSEPLKPDLRRDVRQ